MLSRDRLWPLQPENLDRLGHTGQLLHAKGIEVESLVRKRLDLGRDEDSLRECCIGKALGYVDRLADKLVFQLLPWTDLSGLYRPSRDPGMNGQWYGQDIPESRAMLSKKEEPKIKWI